MADVMASLAAVATVPDQKAKTEQYKVVLQQVLASKSVDACKSFVDHMLSDDTQLVISRQLLQVFAAELKQLPAEVHKPVAAYALERIQPRVVSFEEQVTLIREDLAKVLEGEEEWSHAAGVLAGIDLDSGVRNVDPLYKLGQNIRIAMLYLEDDDTVNAEMFIKKASSLISANADEALELQYKVCYARILDSKRKFIEAALRYYELSSVASTSLGRSKIAEEELEQALASAITCTILAVAGPQRSRMLSTLYKDERTARQPMYPFLEKVYLERILGRSEVEAFSRGLKVHQLAILPDGSTVLDRAVVQHNLLSASKLYNNISIAELATLLAVEPDRAEAVAADMIADGRLPGSIDQVERLIRFDDKVEALRQWDLQIQDVCTQVNEVVDYMVAVGIKVAA